jgi:2-dehydropantoate 2-reductase
MTRIAIIGCGAVGSLFAAHLALLEELEVWAFDTATEHVEAIKRDGLRLTGVGDLLGHPKATSDPSELPPCDFGIVATKCLHTEAAIAATAHAFENGAVASVQNGVGSEEVIAQFVPRVIRGTTFPAGRLLEPGVVQWDVRGETTIGPFEPQPATEKELVLLAFFCSLAHMPTKAVADARGAQWRKVIFNSATNPLGALTGLPHGRLCERRGLRALISELVDEGKAVAAAQDIILDADPEDLINHAARRDVAYDHKASMLQDFLAKRPTEIDWLNGGIVQYGEAHGVPTPNNRAIWELVTAAESAWQLD